MTRISKDRLRTLKLFSFTLLYNKRREPHLQACSSQSARFLLAYFYFSDLASILSHLGKME